MTTVASPQTQDSNAVEQGTLQGAGVIATVGRKLLDSRFEVPVRVGKGERDVFEAPIRVHSGIDGVSKVLANVDTSSAPTARAGQALKSAKLLGRGLVGLGAFLDVRDISKSMSADKARADGKRTETKKAVGRVAGGWGGALAGAKVGAQYGTALPFGGPVAGMVIGSIVGGISGHIAGEKLAS